MLPAPGPRRFCLLAFGLAAAVLAQPVGAQAEGAPGEGAQAVPADAVERLIIRYRADAPATGRVTAASASASADPAADGAARVARSAGLGRVSGLRYLKSVSPGLHVARFDQAVSAAAAQAIVERMQADPAVAAVTVDTRLQAHAAFVDPYPYLLGSAHYQWHLQTPDTVAGGSGAVAAWGRSTGAGVTVAVVDGGYRLHADLAANLLGAQGHDFISDAWTANDGDARDADAQDPGNGVASGDPGRPANCPAGDNVWHGTHVAGLIGAAADGALGIGVAPSVRLLPVRVLGRCGGYLSDILAGMRWAAGLAVAGAPPNPAPARILNLSLGVAAACDANTQSVVDEIRAAGVSLVASTGNGSRTTITTPARCAGVLAVTAHDRDARKPAYANVGPGTAISAPGGDVSRGIASTWSRDPMAPDEDAYAHLYGTSMASAQVAGVLALMASARPDLPMAELEAVLLRSARPFPDASTCARVTDRRCGAGLLDAPAAVAAAQAYQPPQGGGCTAAPPGQADLGLPLLALVAALALLWRRRSPAELRRFQRPPTSCS